MPPNRAKYALIGLLTITHNQKSLKMNYFNHRETPKFKNRLEQLEWFEKQMGWEPLTDEDRAAIEDAVRLVTNLD